MKLDVHQQEELSTIMYFWRDYGKYIIGGVLIILVLYVSNFTVNLYRAKQAKAAAVLYDQLQDKIKLHDNNGVKALVQELENKYPKTEYTAQAGIIGAKYYVDTAPDTAISLLQWNISHAKNKPLVEFSRIDLAKIYIDQKKFDEALDLLMQKHDPIFDGLYYETRGDLYVAKGDLDKAKSAYSEALQKSPKDGGVSQILQFKLEAIGQ